jgi:hypothetical protein
MVGITNYAQLHRNESNQQYAPPHTGRVPHVRTS